MRLFYRKDDKDRKIVHKGSGIRINGKWHSGKLETDLKNIVRSDLGGVPEDYAWIELPEDKETRQRADKVDKNGKIVLKQIKTKKDILAERLDKIAGLDSNIKEAILATQEISSKGVGNGN